MNELTLVLNAAEKRLQFLLMQDNVLLHAEESEPQKNGSDSLLPHIQSACQELGCSPSDIKKIACTAGPGNFMGIRLTATIAAAFVRANDGLQASFSYMQALANNFYCDENKILHIITIGTRELVHSQRFQCINGTMKAISNLELIPFANLAEIPCNYIYGSALRTEKALSALKTQKEKLQPILLPISFDSPSINSFIHCIENCTWQKNDISPIYLKECDAIQNLSHIATQQGRNPNDSYQELERLLKA